jgi:RNA polymerase subunit RPABC4/transcription elongation factor Spt4
MPKSTLRFFVITYLFTAVVLGACLGYAGAQGALGMPFTGPTLTLFVFAVCFALALFWTWLGAVTYIYHDAKGRGMNAALWALIAAFVPYLIGFVIYFLTRKALLSVCPGCGKAAPTGAVHCPHCGYALKSKCAACGTVVEKDHRFCPSCGKSVAE